MVEKIYIVTDIGFGDAGKGTIVQATASAVDAVVVIKTGGAQGSHGVTTPGGESCLLSQWGCATFAGVPTHISPRMIISPVGLLNEAETLRYKHGIDDPFGMLTIDERAICATSLHKIASRLKELARGNNPRGTTGTGIGTALRDSQRRPDLAITAGDLKNLPQNELKRRLIDQREQIRQDLDQIIHGEFLSDDRSLAAKQIARLNSDEFLDYVLEVLRDVGKRATIVDADYLGREILTQDGNAVVESSQGVLIDNMYGFWPHTTAIRTLPSFTQKMLREAGYDGTIINLGVHRAYETRHGAGPMPTADPTMAINLLPGSQRQNSRWQGGVRVGPLDLVLMKYAIEVCGGHTALDGLAITWYDQIILNGEWRICHRYENADNPGFFTDSGKIKVMRGLSENELRKHQEDLGKQLLGCKPVVETIRVPLNIAHDRDKIFSFCADTLEELGVPVRLVSVGPTEKEKIFR